MNEDVKCNIACDYCGKKPANWFQGTSVAVCSSWGCNVEANEAWREHCEGIEREYDARDSYLGDV